MATFTDWIRRHRLAVFFGLTFAISWGAWPFQIADGGPPTLLTFGPLVAALVVIGFAEGIAGYKDLLSRLLRWRIGWWWLVVVATPLAVLAVASLANVAFWGAPLPDLAAIGWGAVATTAGVRMVNAGDGPMGEEPGFRGFALPRLQSVHTPLTSATILASVVTVWHLPLIVGGSLGWTGLPVTFAITYVYVWLFNRTGGSLLATLVFHVLQGTVSSQMLGFAGADAERMDLLTGALWIVIAVAVVTLDRGAWQAAPERAVADPVRRDLATV